MDPICGAAFAAALIILLRGLAFPARDGWVFAVAAAGFLPLIWDLELGQTSALLSLPLTLALLALRGGADWEAGLLLGLLGLKPQLLPIWGVATTGQPALAGARWPDDR